MRSLLYSGIGILGGTGKLRRIDWNRVERLVFICHGNICRSPFAEAVARKRGIRAVSVGLFAEPGAPANVDAIRTAMEFGIDLNLHRATHASDFRPMDRDLLVGFEPSHLAGLNTIAKGSAGTQLTLLGAWSWPPNLYVHDPFGTSIDYFRACFRRIDRVVELLSRQIEDHRKNGRR